MTATAIAPVADVRSRRANLLGDTLLVMGRELRPILRSPFSLLFALVQPLVFLGLFGPLLPQVSGFEDGSSLQWFVPGIIVMSALFACSTTGSNLQLEMQTGSHERMLVTPLSRQSLLSGRAIKEIVPVVGQAALIVAVVIPFGFDLHLAGVGLGLAMIAVFGVGLGALSYALAVVSKGEDWIFWTVQQTLLFPLLLLSGILLPIDSAPGWMQTLSDLNPLTYVVRAERALFAGDLANSSVTAGFVAAALVALVGLAVGVRTIRSGTAG
jgi:ABC-2 type transport system permease protein